MGQAAGQKADLQVPACGSDFSKIGRRKKTKNEHIRRMRDAERQDLVPWIPQKTVSTKAWKGESTDGEMNCQPTPKTKTSVTRWLAELNKKSKHQANTCK